MGVGQSPAGNQGVDLSEIRYGIAQDDQSPADQMEPEEAPADLDAEWREAIKGKYKDQYGKAVQNAIQDRFKKSQAALDAAKAQMPIIDLLASRYGVEATDIQGIMTALQDDNALYEQEAMNKGLDVDTLKAMKKVELENAALRRESEERQRQEGADRIYAQWQQDAEAVRAIYPQFDWLQEIQNKDFADLLRAGVEMQKAYEVMHINEIMPAAMQFAANTVEEKLSKSLATNRNRPRENGMSSQASARVKADPSKLNFDDIDEVVRRSARGERISFG